MSFFMGKEEPMARRGSFRSQLEEKRPGSVSVAPIPILIIGVICIFIGLFVLLPIFPPVGIAWCLWWANVCMTA